MTASAITPMSRYVVVLSVSAAFAAAAVAVAAAVAFGAAGVVAAAVAVAAGVVAGVAVAVAFGGAGVAVGVCAETLVESAVNAISATATNPPMRSAVRRSASSLSKRYLQYITCAGGSGACLTIT